MLLFNLYKIYWYLFIHLIDALIILGHYQNTYKRIKIMKKVFIILANIINWMHVICHELYIPFEKEKKNTNIG